jgi:hypothetical protein
MVVGRRDFVGTIPSSRRLRLALHPDARARRAPGSDQWQAVQVCRVLARIPGLTEPEGNLPHAIAVGVSAPGSAPLIEPTALAPARGTVTSHGAGARPPQRRSPATAPAPVWAGLLRATAPHGSCGRRR